MTALLLLMPGTPMLFQGQEWATSSPFLFFADPPKNIAPLVQKGRREFLAQFRSAATPQMEQYLSDPASADTFYRSKLDREEKQKPRNQQILRLHKDLTSLRRSHPAFDVHEQNQIDGAVLTCDSFLLRWLTPRHENDRLLIVNFGRDHDYSPAPEPLLAPPLKMEWDVIWSSEDPVYGGGGFDEYDTVENWKIPGHSAAVLAPAPIRRTVTPKSTQ